MTTNVEDDLVKIALHNSAKLAWTAEMATEWAQDLLRRGATIDIEKGTYLLDPNGEDRYSVVRIRAIRHDMNKINQEILVTVQVVNEMYFRLTSNTLFKPELKYGMNRKGKRK